MTFHRSVLAFNCILSGSLSCRYFQRLQLSANLAIIDNWIYLSRFHMNILQNNLLMRVKSESGFTCNSAYGPNAWFSVLGVRPV